ncbi:hypothetical protein EV421DRAFT_1060672 [Armillaria borealis]|uniref:Uncharacterized protein n=1 Tax=Armillaria borealis TaxID=47425 RepID=A0AA39MZE9_9AGAR|nr:hypothetical protein EV421DRAFT_1060672 [Armillaria borealis]
MENAHSKSPPASSDDKHRTFSQANEETTSPRRDVIDVDTVPITRETSPARSTNSPHISSSIHQHHPCPGILTSAGAGESMHLTYPFGVHELFGNPWDYSSIAGQLFIHSRTCQRWGTFDGLCSSCKALEGDDLLAGVQHRMKNGTHPNARLGYHGIGALQRIIRKQQKSIRALRLQGLNSTRRLATTKAAPDHHKTWMTAIGSGKVERVDQLVRVGLKRGAGIKEMLRMYGRAAEEDYRPRSYTEEDYMRTLLLWRLGGQRIGNIAHKALSLPAVDTVRSRSHVPMIEASPGIPQLTTIQKNIGSSFAAITEIVQKKRIVHQSVMFDEIKCELRARWDPRTNFILGICREHSARVSLEFKSENEASLLKEALEENQVHLATQATIGAIGLLTGESRLYSARPILLSGTCKAEKGVNHAKLIDTTVKACADTEVRTICLASDGDPMRGEALIRLTFKHTLPENSPLQPILSGLPFMNLEVGDDDLTTDKDYKHVFKCFRNLCLRKAGFTVHGVHIMPSLLRAHLADNGLNTVRINNLLNPDDTHGVKLAYDLLKEIWSLPEIPASTNPHPGFTATRDALRTMGELFQHLLMPYICVDLTLSEQLEHLSSAAHMILALYVEECAKTKSMPSQLYLNAQIMIKNVFFCVAKAQVDDPEGHFWLVLLGTDRLEELFGIVRTMVGNDANVDVLQLGDRVTNATEVSTIFALYPHWDTPPRRLKLPPLTRDGPVIHDRVDHLKPASWKGDVRVSSVDLQTCWSMGRRAVELAHPPLKIILDNMGPAVDMLRPFGVDMVKVPRDEIDDTLELDGESLDDFPSSPVQDLEDATSEEEGEDDASCDMRSKYQPCFELDGKQVHKAWFLKHTFPWKLNSTDRLKRVQNAPRHAMNEDTYLTVESKAGEDVLTVDSTVTTLIRCQNHLFLAIAEVLDITYQNQHRSQIPACVLRDATTIVNYQLLCIIPANGDDDPTSTFDWKWSYRRGSSHQVLGRLVHPYKPVVCTPNTGKPFYTFESRDLRVIASSMLEDLSPDDSHRLPQVAASPDFPYRQSAGLACFVCEQNGKERDILDAAVKKCTYCQPPVVLPTSNMRLLEHMGAHILYDKNIDRSLEPCGLCLRPSPVCSFYLKRSSGTVSDMRVDQKRSVCINKVSFRYKVAATSPSTSLCSNIPVICPECPPKAPAVWKYNMPSHMKRKHPHVPQNALREEWVVSDLEMDEMKNIWSGRHKNKKSKKNKKNKKNKKQGKQGLQVSEAHKSALALEDEISEKDSDSDLEGIQSEQLDPAGETTIEKDIVMPPDLQDATEQIPFSEAPENSHGRKRHAREEVFGLHVRARAVNSDSIT